MKRILLSALLIFGLSAHPALAVERYALDPEHTNVLFSINHLGFSDMVGRFEQVDGQFSFDENQPEKSSVDVTLKPAGIRTSSRTLDEHLQGEDFFRTATFPDIRFVSNGVRITGPREGEVTGNLTMLGVTKPMTLKVRFNKADYHPINNKYMAGFTAQGALKRSEFGMTKYVPMVGDEVRLRIEVEGVNQERAPGPAVKKQ